MPKEGSMAVTTHRLDELLTKLEAHEISRTEAIELNDLLLKEKKKAQDRGDFATVLAMNLGLAALASVSVSMR